MAVDQDVFYIDLNATRFFRQLEQIRLWYANDISRTGEYKGGEVVLEGHSSPHYRFVFLTEDLAVEFGLIFL